MSVFDRIFLLKAKVISLPSISMVVFFLFIKTVLYISLIKITFSFVSTLSIIAVSIGFNIQISLPKGCIRPLFRLRFHKIATLSIVITLDRSNSSINILIISGHLLIFLHNLSNPLLSIRSTRNTMFLRLIPPTSKTIVPIHPFNTKIIIVNQIVLIKFIYTFIVVYLYLNKKLYYAD